VTSSAVRLDAGIKDGATSPTAGWLTRPALAGVMLVLLTTLAGTLAMMFHTPAGIPLLDRAALSVLPMHANGALNEAMTWLTSFGGEVTLMCIFTALVAWAYATRGLWWARFFMVVMAGALAFDNIVKPLVGRPRPIFDQLVNGRGPSWPSGHTTGTTALLFALAIYASAGRGRGLRFALLGFALAGSIVMGATRVYLGVHWPTDAMAGVVLGTVWAATCARVLKIDEIPNEQSLRVSARRALVPLTVTLAFVAVAFTPHF
jgi:membrane-associated phospholipid phosphatase